MSDDIDDITTELSNKVDADLSNINPTTTAINTIIGWSMPDYTQGVSINSLPYTAPADGFIHPAIAALAGTAELFINENKVSHAYASTNTFYSMISGQYQVEEGDIISSNGTLQWMNFFPIKGGNG